jgi:opacity protein-like surface antigen
LTLSLALGTGWQGTASGQGEDRGPAKFTGSAMIGYSTGLEPESPDGSVGFLLNGFSMIEPGIGLGFEVGRQQLGTFEVTDIPPNSSTPVTETVDQDVWQFTGNLMARLVHGGVRPHFNTGLGLYWVETQASQGILFSSETETRFGFNVGGGLSVGPVGKGWAIAIDGRWNAIINGWPGNRRLDTLTVYGGLMIER